MFKGGKLEKKGGEIGKQQRQINHKRLFNKKSPHYLLNAKIMNAIFLKSIKNPNHIINAIRITIAMLIFFIKKTESESIELSGNKKTTI